jgi:hypothetical protein
MNKKGVSPIIAIANSPQKNFINLISFIYRKTIVL